MALSRRTRKRKLRAVRDSLDFRDLIYRPALVPLEGELRPKKTYMTIRDQGTEGACTGFALAAVVNYLLHSRDGRGGGLVSPRMLYEMAKRYDQWPGVDYEGSSARGAMKGWHKHGVCAEKHWPEGRLDPGYLTREAQEDALRFPLGAYYRIQRRRSDMHAALTEVGVVFATCATHRGWDRVSKKGVIPYDPKWKEDSGHAFAIVGYTHDGFIIQNSWGDDWGGVRLGRTTYPGCAIWTYPDFDRWVWDAWVARLARPVESIDALTARVSRYAERPSGTAVVEKAPPRPAIRGHFIHIDDGQFDPWGDYYSEKGEVQELIADAVRGPAQHLLLYAHGGLNSVKGSAARVAAWRPVFQANGVHEIHFIWDTGLLEEIADVLLGKRGAAAARAGGPSDWWDAVVERITHRAGHAIWMEMLSDAEIAFRQGHAGREVVKSIIDAIGEPRVDPVPKVHLVGHSAGSVWFGHLLSAWRELDGPPIENLVLFAPACTHDHFEAHIRPAIAERLVRRLHHFLLTDQLERDDNVARIYRKSLLYLVSRSYQQKGVEVRVMGMEKYHKRLSLRGITQRVHTYFSGSDPTRTTSRSHGGFDNDDVTMNTMLRIILGRSPRSRFTEHHLQGY